MPFINASNSTRDLETDSKRQNSSEKQQSYAEHPAYIRTSGDTQHNDIERRGDTAAASSEDDARTGGGCCNKVRINWLKFRRIVKNEIGELKEDCRKIDLKSYVRSCCTVDVLRRRLPILQWAPKYSLTDLQGDLVAGTTVGLTVIPMSIAYSVLAGVPPQYGLYSAFFGSFVYLIFGSAKDIVLGPSGVSSLLTGLFGASPIANDASFAIALGFFAGIIYLVMFLLGLGLLMDFVSYPVHKAFTNAAAITIASTQVKKWLGQTGVPRDFMGQLYWTLAKIPQARLWDFLLGVCCIVLVVTLKKLKDYKWKRQWDELPLRLQIFQKLLWFLGTGRNIVAIVLASVAAYLFSSKDHVTPFTLTGFIPPGLPPFRLPAFTVMDNRTNITYNLADMSSSIGVGFIVVPVIGLIEAMAIGNVFARRDGYRIDPNQELLAYGIGNILNGLVSGYPITGSFSSSSVNGVSGARTPAGGIITGTIVLLAVRFLTPMFCYIPNCSLAVVIILAVLNTVSFTDLWMFWKTKKIDIVPWVVTFVLSFVVNIAYGVLIGAALSILLILYPAWRPKIRVMKLDSQDILVRCETTTGEDEDGCIIIVKFYGGLLYPAVEYMKDKVIPLYSTSNLPKGVIFDFQHVSVIDTTAVQGLHTLLESFNKNGIRVVFCNMQKSVDEVLRRSKPKFFETSESQNDAANMILNPTPQLSITPSTTVAKQRDEQEELETKTTTNL